MDLRVGFEAVGTADCADGGDFGDRVFVPSLWRYCVAGYPDMNRGKGLEMNEWESMNGSVSESESESESECAID